MIRSRIIFCMFILALCCCKKPFTPAVLSSRNSYLVIEGIINTGNDSTVFKITRTVKLNNSSTFKWLFLNSFSINWAVYFIKDCCTWWGLYASLICHIKCIWLLIITKAFTCTRFSFTRNFKLSTIMSLYLPGFKRCFHSKIVAVKYWGWCGVMLIGL